MIPELAYVMLACARIGAIHSVVFGGFSPESLKDRILDSDCESVITADEGLRGSKKIPLKNNTRSLNVGMAVAITLAEALRQNELAEEFDVLRRSMKALMRDANKVGADYAIIIGDKEL